MPWVALVKSILLVYTIASVSWSEKLASEEGEDWLPKTKLTAIWSPT